MGLRVEPAMTKLKNLQTIRKSFKIYVVISVATYIVYALEILERNTHYNEIKNSQQHLSFNVLFGACDASGRGADT